MGLGWVPYPIPTQKPNYFWVPMSGAEVRTQKNLRFLIGFGWETQTQKIQNTNQKSIFFCFF